MKRKAGQAKVGKVMREYSQGMLHSGSKTGPIVKDAAQAKAIAMSEAGLSRPMVRRVKRGRGG